MVCSCLLLLVETEVSAVCVLVQEQVLVGKGMSITTGRIGNFCSDTKCQIVSWVGSGSNSSLQGCK